MTLTGSAAKRILADEQADGRQGQAHEHDGVHHRQGETVDSSTCHIGFRCVVRKPPGS